MSGDAAMVAENGEEKEKSQGTKNPKNKHPPDRTFHKAEWDPKELKMNDSLEESSSTNSIYKSKKYIHN